VIAVRQRSTAQFFRVTTLIPVNLAGPNYWAAFNCGSWVLTMLSGVQVPPEVTRNQRRRWK